MIAQSSNNKPSGFRSKSCDAGIPIMGRTSDTGVYDILKINSDGSLMTATNIPISGIPNNDVTTAVNNPTTSIKTTGLIVFNRQITIDPLTKGVYKIDPFFISMASTLGSFNFMLYKNGSSLALSCTGLIPFLDSVSFTSTDLMDGFGGFWHNIPQQLMNPSNTTITYSNNSNKEIGLADGQYSLIIWVHTATTMITADCQIGFNEFSKISV
jgi:hypothetical protein